MIFGNIKNLEEYSFLEDKIKECFTYAKENDLMSFDTGRHDIKGDELFVNIVEYETTKPENRFWEAHKDYLDLHLLLDGKEQIDLNFLKNMTLGEYIKEEDYQKIEGYKNSSVTLSQGDFLICYPNDGHMTAIAVDKPQKIKKAIFKIKI
ncbi:MAG: YhcH/YjgK/YiaL family protein [Anaerococcus sp.]|uniref:YhcH/YjgK/YiaL family protein n=1 Tax=Anaerococcus sp. TaxID=1872515 RepID=UPI00260F7DC5|nr:YhcH/YjgK/YiaL family protein [Anaerococcus sp.]MCI5972190.1 YhcH/YjgK/YiaL family protein [Anaerococcus sp.]MDD6919465.1 YhcH/YjgK/YiaL family protein [Peptoniphilaceae bacterium]